MRAGTLRNTKASERQKYRLITKTIEKNYENAHITCYINYYCLVHDLDGIAAVQLRFQKFLHSFILMLLFGKFVHFVFKTLPLIIVSVAYLSKPNSIALSLLNILTVFSSDSSSTVAFPDNIRSSI